MPNRILDLTDGVAMIVTDLHGDRDAFDRYVARFRELHAAGQADRLILLGDLIHHEGPEADDDSLRMTLDVIALRDELGADTVIMLLGNHEMPHIYSVTLSKGHIEYTPRFERALGANRDTVLAFFAELPFYARTASGVLLSHAGPTGDVIEKVSALAEFDHAALLQAADMVLAESPDMNGLYDRFELIYGEPYEAMARHLLAVSGPDDPRYSHLLRAFLISNQNPQFNLLWDALFARNEVGLRDPVYGQVCRDFLRAFSQGAPAELTVAVSGHIRTQGGYAIVNRHHFRLASATHAHPRESGRYLLLDCAQHVTQAEALIGGLGSVFADEA